MSYNVIYTLLRDLTGIDVLSIGEEAVIRVVKGRMKTGGHESLDDYIACIKISASERQSLINEITVPETWFFRDNEPFKLLFDYASRVWSPTRGEKFKLLSIPCSTGEEPYSIAMVLLDAGFPQGSFTIDACDISTRVLELAERGLYGRNSFRGTDLSFRDKYFRENSGFYEVVDEVKEAVSFHHRNVLAPDFMQGRGPYNVIFCRNLLIYFDMETKERVIRSLHRLLSGDGLLFLGHAETGRMVQGLFQSLRHPGAFAYQPVRALEKGEAATKSAASVRGQPSAVTPKPAAAISVSDPPRPTPPPAAAPVTVQQAPVVQAESQEALSLDAIQSLADRGELGAAMAACTAYLQRHPMAADGYYLQGIIFLAEDEDEKARDAFKRAIYLEPDHYQALAHLAVLAEEGGELQAAANYRARMARAQAKS